MLLVILILLLFFGGGGGYYGWTHYGPGAGSAWTVAVVAVCLMLLIRRGDPPSL